MENIVPAEMIEFSSHELVVDFEQAAPNTGLHGFIAIHNSRRGPALGGTRIRLYSNKKEALADVLKLSRAMTYKCTIAGLPFGGGKAVIIADPSGPGLHDILKTYAKVVDDLKGRFYTGEDVGLTEAQVQYMLQFSPYFIGKSDQAGDPSTYAALSALNSILVASEKVFGSSDLTGKKVGVKGLGKTGSELVRLLSEAGAEILAEDIDHNRCNVIQNLFPKVVCDIATPLLAEKLDIYAPCALGDDITEENVDLVQAKIVAGTANNQLSSQVIAEKLFVKGILHVPDYIANAGGLIDVADELLAGGYDKPRVLDNIEKLRTTLRKVLDESSRDKINPDAVADKMVQNLLLQHDMIAVENIVSK